MNLIDRIGRSLSAVSCSTGFGDNFGVHSFGNHVYAGRVNRHTVFIKAKPHEVYHFLVDSRGIQRWCPQDKITVEKITPGKLGLGTKIRYRLNYRINPVWHSVVVNMEENSRIINRFVDGIFDGSAEIWQIKKVDKGAELSHILIYRIKGLIFRIGWIFLGGKAKHNELTEEALGNIKRILEGKPHALL